MEPERRKEMQPYEGVERRRVDPPTEQDCAEELWPFTAATLPESPAAPG